MTIALFRGIVVQPSAENRDPGEFKKPVQRGLFGYQGIGANLLLTVAAAAVPVLIIGVAAFSTISDAKLRGGRSTRKNTR